ncbi:hypothetical protein [Streptomyces sp. NPDC060035]|uniref:hypothetical protein n=1 Tax=Streptomyces sp. NPDC060035 TaxID=3347044 RepID=UPI0036B5D432
MLEQAARVCAEETEPPVPSPATECREAAFDKAWWSAHRTLADNFQQQKGTAAAVGGELLL